MVGVGYLGTFHAQKYKELSLRPDLNFELAAVCDLNFTQAEKVAQTLEVKAFSKPEDLIGKVDMVTLATITPTHFELANLFLKNGIHVNVEKPICIDTSDAQTLVDLAHRNKLALCVGHSERFNPAFQKLKKQLSKPVFLEFNRYAPFKLRGSDVSVLHDLMIHDLDLMLNLDDSAVTLKSARAGSMVTKTYDWCSATFEFASGLRAIVNCSRLAKDMTRTIRAIDDKNIWAVNLQTGEIQQTKALDSEQEPVGFEILNAGRGDNLMTETENFILAVQGLTNIAVTGEDGRKALSLVDLIVKEIQTHNRG